MELAGRMELARRMGPCWPLWPLGHPELGCQPLATGYHPRSSRVPGVVSSAGGCQQGGGHGDGYLRPLRADISADAEWSS